MLYLNPEAPLTRERILTRYRQLRAASIRQHSAALEFLSRAGLLEHARALGMAMGQVLLPSSEEEVSLVFDMALYTSKPGRSRVLDRYARRERAPTSSDDLRILEAMRHARFSIWRVERAHDAAGLVVSDIFREAEEWLVDEGLEISGWEGMCFAARLYRPEDFSMTTGVVVPVDRALIEEVGEDELAWRRNEADAVADDPRFATAVYRAAIASGMMEEVRFNEVGSAKPNIGPAPVTLAAE